MNSLIKRSARLYFSFTSIASRVQSPFLLFVRLYWGWQLMQNGWGKLHNLAQVTRFITTLGIPAPGSTALFVACVEFFGGVLLIAGLASRPTGLGLTGNARRFTLQLIGRRFSRFSATWENSTAPILTFPFAAVLILIFGPGWIALDSFIAHRFRLGRSGLERSTAPTRLAA